MLLSEAAQHWVAAFVQSIQASGRIATELLPMSLRNCRDLHDSFIIFSRYSAKMLYDRVNAVPAQV